MSPRDRRALLAGVAVLAAAFVLLRAAPWAWRQMHRSVEQLQAHAELLERTRAEIRGAKGLEDSAAAVRARFLALAPKLLTGATSAEALAALVGRITVAAEQHRVRLDRTDGVPDSAAGGQLRTVTVRVAIEGDTQGTLNFIASLGTDAVVLTVDQVRIVAPDPAGSAAAPEVLRTDLTVHGWFLNRRDIR